MFMSLTTSMKFLNIFFDKVFPIMIKLGINLLLCLGKLCTSPGITKTSCDNQGLLELGLTLALTWNMAPGEELGLFCIGVLLEDSSKESPFEGSSSKEFSCEGYGVCGEENQVVMEDHGHLHVTKTMMVLSMDFVFLKRLLEDDV